MVRLLHTADIHLGRQFPSLRQRASDYRNQLLKTFERTVDLAVKEQVSLLLIAGDLFDSNRVFGVTVGVVLSVLKKLEAAGVRVCILPGTHDAFTDESIFCSLRFPANVTVFTPQLRQRTYPDLNLTVYGLVDDGISSGKSPLQGLSLSQESTFHVGMAHCSLKRAGIAGDDTLLGEDEIANSGLDYLALGHWHSFVDVSQGATKACYSGAPEPIDMDQKGAGHVVIVTLRGKNNVELQPLRIGSKKAETLTIDVSSCESVEGIMKAIEGHADPDLILTVTLTGLRSMDCEFNSQELENALGGHFNSLRVDDRSHPKLDEIKVQNYPDKTVVGRFLRIMEEKIAATTIEEEKSLSGEAMRLGFALLQGHSQVIE